MTPLKVKRVREYARLPIRGSSGAAAYDLSAAIQERVIIEPGKSAILPTGLAIELPEGLVALIFSRSGQGIKSNVSLSNSVGVIDSDFRGEMQIGLINHGTDPFVVHPGDRIAQLMLTYALEVQIEECDTLSESQRAQGGLGSTGV